MGQGLLVHALPQGVEQAALDHHGDQGEMRRCDHVHIVALAAHDGVCRYPLSVEKKILRVFQRHRKAVNAVVKPSTLSQGNAGVFAKQRQLRQLNFLDAALELSWRELLILQRPALLRICMLVHVLSVQDACDGGSGFCESHRDDGFGESF